MTWDELCAELSARRDAEREAGAAMFLDWPDRWYDGPEGARLVRCPNDHVSSCVLMTDRGGLCMECGEHAHMTFPEDRDGPLRRGGEGEG